MTLFCVFLNVILGYNSNLKRQFIILVGLISLSGCPLHSKKAKRVSILVNKCSFYVEETVDYSLSVTKKTLSGSSSLKMRRGKEPKLIKPGFP
jgi:hypothetical protein